MTTSTSQTRKTTNRRPTARQTPQRPRRPWRHPFNRSLKVPYRTAAAISMMEMGITDYALIARAVGLDVGEVAQIDKAEERPIRELCLEGIPYGEYFTLEQKVRCPKCRSRITLTPCVACDRRHAPE